MEQTRIAIGARGFARRGLLLSSLLAAGAFALALPAGAQPSSYSFSLPPASGPPGGIATVGLELDSSGGSAIAGCTAAVCSDPALAAPVSADLGGALATVQGGQPPDFVELDFYPSGFTASAVFDFIGQFTLPPGAAHQLLQITYSLSPAAQIGASTPLSFCTIGTPRVSNTVVVSGAPVAPSALIDGEIAFTAIPDYLRGDANEDGTLSITDAVVILEMLFFGMAPGSCPRTSDANSDGVRDIADVIALLDALILSSAPLPPPFPTCGTDPFTSVFVCLPYPACP